jgi:putative transposase
MLDDHLFNIDLESWEASIAVENGRAKLKLLHGTYHEKFKEMKIGQAWLVKTEDGFYLKVVFSKTVELAESNGRAIAVDINENNVAFGSTERVKNIGTGERAIRTAYFLKRRRLQLKPRLNEKTLMAKYKGRERRRVEDIYHKLANQIVDEAKGLKASTILLEGLANIRRRIRRSKAINGRLNRWSFRKLQEIIEYKAKLAGLNVTYVDAKGTSSLCPICGGKLSPNGYRRLKCSRCGLEEDRDIIAVKNLLRRYQMDVGASPVHPESPPMIRGGKG